MSKTRSSLHRSTVVVFCCLVALQSAVSAQQWTAQSSGTTNVLNGVWFIDPLHGFVVGNAGTVLETPDGGLSWAPLTLTADDLLDVAFLDDSIGLMVGDNGRILRTANGGQSWIQVTSGTDTNLAAVAFGGMNLAYAAGRDGTILRSTDAGQTWAVLETGTVRYRNTSAVGQHAWIVGNGGEIRATTDGGATWFSPASGTANDLHDVVFVDTNEGWIAGQNNLLLYTNDGGLSWSPRNSSINVGLNAVFFGNSNTGWTAGGPGDIYGSTDGALSWRAEPPPVVAELDALHFPDAFHGWAVGDAGTILVRRVPAVQLTLDGNMIAWSIFSDGETYDLVFGDLGALRSTGGDFSMATDGCLANDLAGNSLEFQPSPSPGQAFWFLVRVVQAASGGTYDSGSFRQPLSRDGGIGAAATGCP